MISLHDFRQNLALPHQELNRRFIKLGIAQTPPIQIILDRWYVLGLRQVPVCCTVVPVPMQPVRVTKHLNHCDLH